MNKGSKLVRFSISIDRDLVKEFDKRLSEENLPNRSKAISTLIHRFISERKAISKENIAGAIGLIYNHHTRMISDKITSIQHNYHDVIVSTQHIHLNHDICFEVIIVKGSGKKIEKLFKELRRTKGVLNSYLTVAS